MERREFLIGLGAALVAPPAMAALAGCGSSNSATSFDVVSSVVNGHTHSITVLDADVANPPAVGVVYTTTFAGGHVHTVPVSRTELLAIQAAQSVNETSSLGGQVPHEHTFAIAMPRSSSGNGRSGY